MKGGVMCIIKIIKDGDISNNEIESLWKNNPHGGGIGLIDNDLNLRVPIRTHEYELFRDELQKLLKEQILKHWFFI